MPTRITYNFQQDYSNWDQGTIFDDFYQHHATLSIMDDMDEIDMKVVVDHDLTLANTLINNART
jgi:hypothetical protein